MATARALGESERNVHLKVRRGVVAGLRDRMGRADRISRPVSLHLARRR
jgi:hypothetical protein